MGRNAKRRRERRDQGRAQVGREVRTTVEERAGSRVRSVIRPVTGFDRVEVPKNKDEGSSTVALRAAALAAWAGTLGVKP